jgi:hypothetical protein
MEPIGQVRLVHVLGGMVEMAELSLERLPFIVPYSTLVIAHHPSVRVLGIL